MCLHEGAGHCRVELANSLVLNVGEYPVMLTSLSVGAIGKERIVDVGHGQDAYADADPFLLKA